MGAGDALADGQSEGISAQPFSGQTRAGVTPDYTITLSDSMTSDSSKGYDVINANTIRLNQANKVYEITESTAKYGIQINANCTLLLNGVNILPVAKVCPLDLNGNTIVIVFTRRNGESTYIKVRPRCNGRFTHYGFYVRN